MFHCAAKMLMVQIHKKLRYAPLYCSHPHPAALSLLSKNVKSLPDRTKCWCMSLLFGQDIIPIPMHWFTCSTSKKQTDGYNQKHRFLATRSIKSYSWFVRTFQFTGTFCLTNMIYIWTLQSSMIHYASGWHKSIAVTRWEACKATCVFPWGHMTVRSYSYSLVQQGEGVICTPPPRILHDGHFYIPWDLLKTPLPKIWQGERTCIHGFMLWYLLL